MRSQLGRSADAFPKIRHFPLVPLTCSHLLALELLPANEKRASGDFPRLFLPMIRNLNLNRIGWSIEKQTTTT